MPRLNAEVGLGGAFIAGVVTLVSTDLWWVALLAAAAGYVVGAGIYKWFYRRSSLKYQKELRRLADSVVQELSSALAARVETEGEAMEDASQPLLDKLDESTGAEGTESKRKTGLR